MNNNKSLIGAILTMIVGYLLISFAVWELNAKYWKPEVRVMYAMFAPIFSVWVYSGIKLYNNEQQ